MLHKVTLIAGWLAILAGLLPLAVSAQAIYTCVDGKGRKITSDRPILECIDRSQQEITPSGTVKRVLGPSLTARESAALEEKQRLASEERFREAEDKRRDRALLLRYPSREVHDKERRLALDQVDGVIKAAAKRTQELAELRRVINAELEFYAKDPSRAPAPLKRQIDENDHGVGVQTRFIADQDIEKTRVNTRFDEELVKLKQLWALRSPTAATVSVTEPASATRASAKR